MLQEKRFIAILLALAFSLCTVSMALAGKAQHGKNVRFSAAGVVTAVTPADWTMTVELEKANRTLKEFIDDEFLFTVSEDVKIKTEGTEAGVFDLSLDDITVNDTVRVLGKKLADGNYQITHIVVYQDE